MSEFLPIIIYFSGLLILSFLNGIYCQMNNEQTEPEVFMLIVLWPLSLLAVAALPVFGAYKAGACLAAWVKARGKQS